MTALQKIQKEAAKIRAAKPSLKYTDAIKIASKNYNAGKLGAVKKKNTPRLPVKKIVTTVTKEKMSGQSSMHQKTFITLTDIGNELLQLENILKNKSLKIAQRNVYKNQFKALKAYLNTKAKFV